MTLSLKPFSPLATICDCVTIMSSIAGRRDLPIDVEAQPGLEEVILLGDADRIRQILLNLLSNAVKFTSNGSVTVTARAEASPDGATLLHIWVTDTGIGIPEDRMSRLFERFSQVDGSMSRNYGGTGLGLAICKRIVRLMGGEIGVESQPGHGSTFWFSLPLQSVELPCSARAICRNGDDAIPRRRSVLLVEDTELNREIAVAMMEAAGHTVDAAANGAQALQCAAAKTYDLILMDIQMPDMDGITVAKHIRAGSAQTPALRSSR
jgi:hypothetical protein